MPGDTPALQCLLGWFSMTWARHSTFLATHRHGIAHSWRLANARARARACAQTRACTRGACTHAQKHACTHASMHARKQASKHPPTHSPTHARMHACLHGARTHTVEKLIPGIHLNARAVGSATSGIGARSHTSLLECTHTRTRARTHARTLARTHDARACK